MILTINLELCSKCGSCELLCPTSVINLEEKGAVEKYPDYCINCGHCVSVCPENAIKHSQLDENGFSAVEKSNISYNDFNILTKNRRSIRQYQKKPISETHIKIFMESIKYIPTGSNKQALKYIIISNPDRINKIREEMVNLFKKFIKEMPKFEARFQLVRKYQEKGIELDIALRNAPTLLIIYAANDQSGSWDAGIASYHISLMAEILGIGTCLNGYHTGFSNSSEIIRKISMIPNGHRVLASICMGYPKKSVRYYKVPYRKPVNYQMY